MTPTSRRLPFKAFGVAILALSVVATTGVAANAATAPTASIGTLTSNVYQANSPTNGTSLLTLNSKEIDSAAASYGYTDIKGATFKASSSEKTGLSPVYRLYKSGDFIWVPKWSGSNEVTNAVSKYGYTEQGVNFYASATKIDGSVGVERFIKGSKHFYAVSDADKAAALKNGMKSEGVSFYAAPAAAVVTPPVTPPVSTKGQFTIAVIPDTQQEVLATSNDRFAGRSKWLVANKDKLNLKYAVHTGDVANWGQIAPAQYVIADKAMNILSDNGIPFTITPGNHDTGAVGVGGGAANPKTTQQTVRDTSEFNKAFPASEHTSGGASFDGTSDNSYQTFAAGGEKFLVVSLELWPRQNVVDWAKTVVASHPDYNVIISTHSYLNADSSIDQSAGYGATSGQSLYNQLISQYPNIKIVLSGHVGEAGYREDTGVNGNKIVSYLGTFHSSSNPVRLLNVDTATDTLTMTAYAPQDGQTYSQYNKTTKVDLVK